MAKDHTWLYEEVRQACQLPESPERALRRELGSSPKMERELGELIEEMVTLLGGEPGDVADLKLMCKKYGAHYARKYMDEMFRRRDWNIDLEVKDQVKKELDRRSDRAQAAKPGENVLTHSGLLRGLVTIYALHPLSKPEEVRYVGQSVRPFARFEQHINSRNEVGAWARSVIGSKGDVAMSVIEEVDAMLADECEAHWILHYLSLGLADLNLKIPRTSSYVTYLSFGLISG